MFLHSESTCLNGLKKGALSWLRQLVLKGLAKMFQVVHLQSVCPSLTILVPLRFIIITLVFFYLSKLLFSGFIQLILTRSFVFGQNKNN